MIFHPGNDSFFKPEISEKQNNQMEPPIHWRSNSFLRCTEAPLQELSNPDSDPFIRVQWMDFWPQFEDCHLSRLFNDHPRIKVVNDDPDVVIGSLFGEKKQQSCVPLLLLSWECRNRWLRSRPSSYNRWGAAFLATRRRRSSTSLRRTGMKRSSISAIRDMRSC